MNSQDINRSPPSPPISGNTPPLIFGSDSSPPDTTNEADAPPDYEGLIPSGLNLLAVVRMEFDKQGTYFSPERPHRLEEKIPNLTYSTRMKSLNAELGLTENQNSIQYLKYFGWAILVVAINCVIVSTVLYFVVSKDSGYSNFTWAPIAIPVLLIAMVPTTAKYLEVIENHVKRWTKEDQEIGINLTYSTQAIRVSGKGTLIHVKILVFEKTMFAGENQICGEALPTYST
ncbi:hypothetical protein BDR26DRAFT_865258 [Obelidium mucronatum]|nr:hypothetical protein BDR26DRAFT_865258 [Obelidium mucronatum]